MEKNPQNKQYIALRRAMNSPSSNMETLGPNAHDPFAHTLNGYSYAQLAEIKMKRPGAYELIMKHGIDPFAND